MMGYRDRLISESCLADARRSGNTNHASAATDRSIQQTCDRCNFGIATYQCALWGAAPLGLVGQAKKATGHYRSIDALEVHLLGVAQQGGVLNQSGGGF